MERSSNNPACPLTEAQIAHVADRALGINPAEPVPQTPALTRLTAIIDSLAQPALEQPSESLIGRLVRLEGRARLAGTIDRAADALTAGLTGAVRLIVAAITFDSRVSPALSGFRGSASAIQLAFTCEAGRIHLQITEPDAPDTLLTLRGAFEPAAGPAQPPDQAWQFVLTPTTSDAAAVCDDLDEDLMFTLRVAPGTYRAHLRRASELIDLGEIEAP